MYILFRQQLIHYISRFRFIEPFLLTDTKEALDFLERIREKTKESDEATILCLTAMGNIHLLANDHAATKVGALNAFHFLSRPSFFCVRLETD